MNRRGFLGMSLAAAGMVFAPKFGRWHRQGSGLLVPKPGTTWYVALYTSDGKYHRIPATATKVSQGGYGAVVVDFQDVAWSAAQATTLTHYSVEGNLSGLEIPHERRPFWGGGISLQGGDTLTIQWPDYGLRLLS